MSEPQGTRVAAVLDSQRWRETRDELDAMASKLYTLAETDDGWISRNLHSLAAEVSVLAEQYAQKLKAHDALKMALEGSLIAATRGVE